jgi:hypothetical protein
MAVRSGTQGIGLQGSALQGFQAVDAAVSAGLATVTIAAFGATPQTTTATGLANVTVTANSPTPLVTVTGTGLANVTVTAYNPSVSTSGGSSTTANAGVASVSVTALAPGISVAISGGVGAVAITSYGATVPGNVDPGNAIISDSLRYTAVIGDKV